MLSAVRRRLTYANVAVTLALVFAMSGGAYAAGRYLITSTKQISPKVLKALQGRAGAHGTQGAAGVQGPAGPTGSTGAAGVKGETGPQGAPGEPGQPGEAGKPGKDGSPWTAAGTLPSGKSETGTWAYFGSTENGARGVAAISFPVHLASASEVEFVYANHSGAHCTGTAAAPSAPAGYLCVYDAVEEEPGGKPGSANFLGPNTGEQLGANGAGKEGALLNFETTHIGESGYPFALAEGTWIVTAE